MNGSFIQRAVRNRGGSKIRGLDDLGDAVVPGAGSLELALGARTRGFIQKGFELRRGLAPSLTQRRGKFIAAGKFYRIERLSDAVVSGALVLLHFGKTRARIVLAQHRALGIAAIGPQRKHALEDRSIGCGKAAGLQAILVTYKG